MHHVICMKLKKSKIVTGTTIQYAVLLLGLTIFILFLSYTPKIMESFIRNNQELQALETSFITYEYGRLTKGIINSTITIAELEKRLNFLKNNHLIEQISATDTDIALLLQDLSSNLDSYISINRNKNEESVPPLLIQNILHNFKELPPYIEEYVRIQLITFQMTNIFIITLLLFMGVINMYIDLIRKRELRYKAELRALHKNTLLEIEKERKEINSAIHDHVLQDMAIVRRNINTLMENEAAEAATTELEGIERGIRKSIQSLRKVLDGLPVWDTTSLSFEANMMNIVQDTRMLIDAEIDVTVLGLKSVELSTMEMEQLLSIMHEALYNAVKHAKASVIKVKALRAEGKLKMIIQDNGSGFKPHSINTGDEIHIGLLSMRERAWTIGADFELKSSIGNGTSISVTLDVGDT